MSQHCSVIIPAAGNGTRMGTSCPKQFLELAGMPLLAHTITAFHIHPEISLIVLVVPEERIDTAGTLLEACGLTGKTEIISGGRRRQDSVRNGLEHIGIRSEIILVHDGARPLVSQQTITDCIAAVRANGAAIAAVPVKDTLKKADTSGMITATVDRTDLWQAQTPQGARREILVDAFNRAGNKEVTDEAMLLELAGYPVYTINGSEKNIKITRPEDLTIAENLLMEKQNDSQVQLRIGHGYDAHRFAMGRQLVLAGIRIHHDMGLEGHSDADAATHALCDAILGALAKGDLGEHFPDTSEEYRDIYSIKLLEMVTTMMHTDGYSLNNADITIICQKPKLAAYIDEMRSCLAKACNTEKERINIKATTTEKMGFTGRGEGISCHAVVTIIKG